MNIRQHLSCWSQWIKPMVDLCLAQVSALNFIQWLDLFIGTQAKHPASKIMSVIAKFYTDRWMKWTSAVYHFLLVVHRSCTCIILCFCLSYVWFWHWTVFHFIYSRYKCITQNLLFVSRHTKL